MVSTLVVFFAFGAAGTGKTSTLMRLLGKNYVEKLAPTLVIDYLNFSTSESQTKYRLWDSSGSEKNRSLVTRYYKNIYIFIGFFDVAKAENTLNALVERAKDIQQKAKPEKNKKIPLILVGSKADLAANADILKLLGNAKTQLETLGFEIIVENQELGYIPVSAKEDTGIKDTLLNAMHRAAGNLALVVKPKAAAGNVGLGVGLEPAAVAGPGFFQNHPNAKMALAVTGLVLGMAAIAAVTILTCGVAGILGATVAAIATTLTLHAGLTTVGIASAVAGLFAVSAMAKCSHIIHNTRQTIRI